MFSNRIANSARFLQMPAEAQVLYFHMVLRADDDGVVESYALMKLLGSAPDNFKVLAAKGFIRQLNEDQVIVITDWLEHNTIRADRKVNSIYTNLLVSVAPDIPRIVPKPRVDVEDNSKRVGGQSTDGISKVKLSKVKLKEDQDHTPALRAEDDTAKFIFLFKNLNPTLAKLYGRKPQREAATRLLKLHPLEWWERFIPAYTANLVHDKFCPRATTPIQMEDKLGAIMIHGTNNKKNKLTVGSV